MRMFYGAACFFIDKLGRRKLYAKGRLMDSLGKLNGKEDVRSECYLFYVKRITNGMLCILFTLFFSMVVEWQQGDSVLKSLMRPQAGKRSSEVTAVIVTENETQEITITLNPQKLTEQEVEKILDNAYEQAQKLVLAENETFEHISKKLNFVDEIIVGEVTVQASWASSCREYINYDGTLEGVETPVEGTLYLTLSCEDYEKIASFEITLMPPEKSDKEILAEKIQAYIDDDKRVYEANVDLPNELGGEKLKFLRESNNTELIIMLIGTVIAVLIWFKQKEDLAEQMKKRNEELQRDYSEIVLRIALLQEAGISIYNAWEKLVQSYEKRGDKKRYIFSEMKLALRKVRNGMSEITAFIEFGKRCGGTNFARLTGLLEQNIKRGSRGFSEMLYHEASEAMQQQRNSIRKKGEELNSKLLFPMGMLLVLLLIMVLVPAFMKMNL